MFRNLRDIRLCIISQMELDTQGNQVKMLGKGIFESYQLSNALEKVVFVSFMKEGGSKKFLYNKGRFVVYSLPVNKPRVESSFRGILKGILSIIKQYTITFFFMKKIIENEKINLIKVENIILLGFPVLLVSKYKNVPYVLWIGGPEHKVLNIKVIRDRYLSKLLLVVFNILALAVIRGASVVVNISAESAHMILSKNPRKYIFLNANYVDINTFYEKPCKFRKDKFVVLFVGRLEKEKGIEILIDAIEKIHKKRKDFEVWIIGYGSMYNYIREIVVKKNLPIKLLGKRDIRELPDYYNCADIFVLPSLAEGVSAALLEAMACGVPIVATTGPIENYKTGIVVERNPNAIAEAIIKLLNNKELRKNLSNNAKNFAKELSIKYFKTMMFIYALASGIIKS
ncbi:MAG: glycosyltransferase family 4 protein [Candidatus Njordarchaeales archaeon]